MNVKTVKPTPSSPGYRVRTADRTGIVSIPAKLDALLPLDHPARLVWAAIETLDLTDF
jgi:hypothetical protein